MLDSEAQELAMAQEPESGKPGTNVGGLFLSPYLIRRLWILSYCPRIPLIVLERLAPGI
jgi:hypothetical protein